MTADPDQLRFYVDESALGLGRVLAIARKDTIHVGHPLIHDECPLGTADEDWMPVVASRDLAVICRDKRIRTRPVERQRFMEAGLRVFCIGWKQDLSTWDWLRRLIRHWDSIEHVLRTRGAGPWFYLVNDGGLRELTLSE